MKTILSKQVKTIKEKTKGAKTTQTKQSIRHEWNRRNMKSYAVTLHKENDKDIIDYVENGKENGESASNLFRQAVREKINK